MENKNVQSVIKINVLSAKILPRIAQNVLNKKIELQTHQIVNVKMVILKMKMEIVNNVIQNAPNVKKIQKTAHNVPTLHILFLIVIKKQVVSIL